MKRNYPFVTINETGEEWLKKGQMWMFRNNYIDEHKDLKNGEIVDIHTTKGEYLGTGFYNATSHIVVRILTKNEEDIINRKFFRRRIQWAYDYRKTVEYEHLTNCRYVYGEADLLPGLIVDRYNDILVTQVSVYGLEMIKDMIYELLFEVFDKDHQKIKGIYERNDVNIRSKEGLELYKGWYGNVSYPTKTVILENNIKLNVDIENGQKTGYFLDQKSNRMLLQKMAHGKRVLDCFSHTGGFALNAAKGGASMVTAVDVSKTALDQGYENAKMNGLEDRIKFVQADVFKYLDECEKNAYDIIVLDPPAFTKSRRTIDHAYKGYKEINQKAMELLGRGGYLISCTCSRYMEIENYEKMLKEAARDAGVTLKQVSVTQQNHDHPILWTMSETSYLKFYIFQLV